MDKRTLLLGLAALPFLASKAEAKQVKGNQLNWTVPDGCYSVKVRSFSPDGTKLFSRAMSVEPGQTFEIEAIIEE